VPNRRDVITRQAGACIILLASCNIKACSLCTSCSCLGVAVEKKLTSSAWQAHHHQATNIIIIIISLALMNHIHAPWLFVS
jgi:hypothetical protein